jgi:hypothetical protein
LGCGTQPNLGVFELLEKLTKAAVVLLAVSYALGLLVTNQALIELGVSDYSSVRPKYILTGLWSLLLIVTMSLPILLPLLYDERSQPVKKRLNLALKNLVVTILFVFVTDIATFKFLGFNLRFQQLNILKIFTLIGAVWIAIVFVLNAGLMMRRSNKKINRVAAIAILVMLFLGLDMVGVTSLIADNFYRFMPEASGGGEAVFGYLILKKDGGEDFWKEAGIAQDADITSTPRSRFIRLLYQDEHVMVIQVHGKLELKRLTLNKSLVDAFVTDTIIDRTGH